MKQAIALWSVVLLLSHSAPAAPKQVASVEGMTEHRLDNGMRILLYPDPTRPMVTVNLTVFVGSRHEGYGEGGMAHLLEHMLFKGTPTHPRFDKLMAERGARWNGTTDFDRTNYFETLIATDENLEFAIKLEADRLVNCPIKPEDLTTEMTVVRNEFERSENDPAQVLVKKVLAAAYEWHNYGKSVIGNRSDIERVPADALRRFYQKYYQPDNAMLIVAGKFDEAKALAFAEKYFGPIPRPARVLEPTYTEEPPQDGERVVTLKRVGIVGGVGMLFHVPAAAHEDFPAVDVLRGVLADSPSGEMYKALVEGKKAASVFGWAEALHDPGFVAFGAVVRPDQSIEEARKAMLDVIDRAMDKGVTDEQVQRVKKRFASERKRQLVDTTRVAVELSSWAAMGDWRMFFLMRDRMEAATPQQVQAVAKKYLRPSNRTVGIYTPTLSPDRSPVPPAPDLARLFKDYKGRGAVAAGELLDPDPLKIESRIQREAPIGGVKVALLPKKTRQEMAIVRLALRYGDENNLKGKRPAAEALPALMVRGTKKLSHQQLQDALDEHEATLSAGGGLGLMTLTIQAPRSHLPAALELLRQVLREPAFADSEMEVWRREKLAELENNRTEPQALAANALAHKLHPHPKDDVRYEPTLEEQAEQIKALKVEDVRALHQQYLSAAAGELALVGDFDPAPTLSTLRSALEGWTAPVPYTRITRTVPDGLTGSVESIETPDKANATFLAGLLQPLQDSHPDFPALSITNQVLGGNSSARLWQRVREKEGLSYGVGSSLQASPLDPYAQLRLYAICNPANMAKVHAAVREEVDRLVKEGVTAEEVERAKAAFLQRRTMDRTRESSLAGTLAEHLLAGRTMQFEADFDERVKALTPDQVSAAARKYFEPARTVIVTAGDFAKAATSAPSDKKEPK